MSDLFKEKDLLRTLRLNRTTLRVFDMEKSRGSNHHCLGYQFKVGKKIVFEGTDFGCPFHQPIDSLATAYSILSFLTLRPGDTDKEYFEDYTAEQMEWARSSKCEYLKFMVSDWEEKNGWD